MNDHMRPACPDERLAQAVEAAGEDERQALRRTAELIVDYPYDPRLHFLHGSLLAAGARYAEARESIRRAVDLAPDYAIARFQLGLLELSSGDAAAAAATLEPLADSQSETGLGAFARGLRLLAADDLAGAAQMLREGVSRNLEHPLVNRDMEMMIARIEETMRGSGGEEQDVSAVHLLLRQYATKPTRH
jgi:tetratricopeptide (TPR) repeat protein